MKLILSVSSRNENDDGGCVLAWIDLTHELAQLALRRIERLCGIRAEDKDADEIYYWNYDAVFFDPFVEAGGSLDVAVTTGAEQLLDRLAETGNELIEADPAFHVPQNQIARVECGQMIARQESVAFIAIPKHASFYVETAEIPLEVLRRVANLT